MAVEAAKPRDAGASIDSVECVARTRDRRYIPRAPPPDSAGFPAIAARGRDSTYFPPTS